MPCAVTVEDPLWWEIKAVQTSINSVAHVKLTRFGYPVGTLGFFSLIKNKIKSQFFCGES